MAASPQLEALAVRRLSKSYDSRTVVGPLDFALAPGSVTGLLGGNGAGKTTTIGMIMGLIEPTGGRHFRAWRDMARRSRQGAGPDEFRKPLCRHAAPAHGAAKFNVFAMLYGVAEREEKIARLARISR